MIHRALTRSMFFAGLMLSSTVFADPDIVKCIDSDGKVTLTDARCPAADQTVAVVAGGTGPAAPEESGDENEMAAIAGESSDTPAGASAPTVERHYTAAVWPKRDFPGVRKHAGGGLSRDVATLKAARHNLMLQDSAAQAARSQRLAALQ
ncbi:DUF4124 domain-containing protein [Massilia atriviolacea]|nr:DUF4124 domain-containing protein [Massilia atriviolacea]